MTRSSATLIHKSFVRVLLTFSVVLSLLLSNAPCVIRNGAWTLAQGRSQEERRDGHPKPGKPAAKLPNLDTLRTAASVERDLPAAIPSTMRSKRNAEKPWDGKRFGDPITSQERELGEAEALHRSNRWSMGAGKMNASVDRGKRAHATRRVKATLPPPILDDTFIDNFYSYALPSYPSTPMANEKAYWRDQFRAGYNHGQGALKLAAIEMGKTLFESAAYAARVPARSDHDYVWISMPLI